MIDWIELYKDILEITTTVPDLTVALQRSLGIVKKHFQFDVNAVFVSDDSGERLILKAIDGIDIKDEREFYFTYRAIDEGLSVISDDFRVINNQQELEILFTYIPEEIKNLKNLVLKIQKLEEKRSILIALGNTTASEKQIPSYQDIEITLRYITDKITNADIIRNANNNILKLQRLNEIGTALNSATSLQTLLDLVVKTAVELIPSSGSVLRILNKENNMLEVKANFKAEEIVGRFPSVKLGEYITGSVVESGTPVLINDVNKRTDIITPIREIPVTSVLCVPLKAEDKVIGTLALIDRYPAFKDGFSKFTENDMKLLSTLASQAAVAVEKTYTYEGMQKLDVDNNKKLRELTILHEISNAMRLTTNLTRRLYMLLTAVTIQDGLGYNRAFILMLNERTNILQGMLGVGPDSAQEAGRIWSSLTDTNLTLQNAIRSEDYMESLMQSQINKIAKTIRLDITKSDCILARTVKEKRPFNVGPDADCVIHKEILQKLQTDNFASVPLLARDKVIGILLVDNIYNKNPITDDEIRFLSVFANQAGLAIETTRLYSYLEETNEELKKTQQRLIESEKLAALGEMAATVAHEIRNPLVSIGGFARRLKSRMPEVSDQTMYLDIMIKEVQRLEKILKDILNFSKEPSLDLKENNINDLIQDIIIMFSSDFKERNIDIKTDFDKNIPLVYVDILQMKQAIINIITNSQQAINRNGAITIRTLMKPENGQVGIEISDTGGGIPPKLLDNIFSPFFTTKNYGIGLGLAITKKIVENQHGSIDITNKVGEGIIFEINLPINQNSKDFTLIQAEELNGGNNL